MSSTPTSVTSATSFHSASTVGIGVSEFSLGAPPFPEYDLFEGHPHYDKILKEEGKQVIAHGVAAAAQSGPSSSSHAASSSMMTMPWDDILDDDEDSGNLEVRLPSLSSSAALKEKVDPETERERAEAKKEERRAAEATLSVLFDKMTGKPTTGTFGPPSVHNANRSPELAHSHITAEPLTESESARMRALFRTVEGRRAFASVLNRQRNRSGSGGLRLSPLSYQLLADAIMACLDEAYAVMHVSPVLLLMIMSQSFYMDHNNANAHSTTVNANGCNASNPSSGSPSFSPAGDRRYLLEGIVSHRIWSDIRFWESAFMESLHRNVSTSVRLRRWMAEKEQEMARNNQRELAFSVLSTIAHNMKEFGVKNDNIAAFVEKLALVTEVDTDKMQMLKSVIALDDAPSNQNNKNDESPLLSLSEAHGNADSPTKLAAEPGTHLHSGQFQNIDEIGHTVSQESEDDTSHTNV